MPYAAKDKVKVDKGKFKAFINDMPRAHHKLIVNGEVEVPTTGWEVTLSEAQPPGINPNILILQLDATRPSGHAGDVVTHLPVHFDKANSNPYKQVTIRGGEPEITIDVKHVA